MLDTAWPYIEGTFIGISIITLAMFAVGRIGRLLIKEEVTNGKKRILIWGAGGLGLNALHTILQNPNSRTRCRVVGFIDDDTNKIGRYAGVLVPIEGRPVSISYPIHGGVGALDQLLDSLKVDEVVIAVSSPNSERKGALEAICSNHNIPIHDASTPDGVTTLPDRCTNHTSPGAGGAAAE